MAKLTTTTTSLPGYVQQPAEDALKSIQDFLNSDANYVYGSKDGESLFTPLSGAQQTAIGNAKWLAGQDLASMFGINDAGSLWADFADDAAPQLTGTYGPAKSVSTERLVDEGGWLGKMSDYINPYIQQVLAPQIREIDEATQRQRRDLGASAAMSGSFGDARHGIAESEMYKGANEAVSDATGRAYSDAWTQAMSARASDIARKAGIDTTNASFEESAINRLLQRDLANQGAQQTATANKAAAAQGISGLGQQYFNLFTDVNDTLFNAGEVERNAEIEKNEAMRAFQEAVKNKKYDDAAKLLAAINGTPAPTTSTSEQKSNDGLWGVLGALLSGGIAAAL